MASDQVLKVCQVLGAQRFTRSHLSSLRESLSFKFTSYYEYQEFMSFELFYKVGFLTKDQVTKFYESYRILQKSNLFQALQSSTRYKFYETKFIDKIFNDVNITVLPKDKFIEKFIPKRFSLLTLGVGGTTTPTEEQPQGGMSAEDKKILDRSTCDWIFCPSDLRRIINLHLKAKSKFKMIAKLG